MTTLQAVTRTPCQTGPGAQSLLLYHSHLVTKRINYRKPVVVVVVVLLVVLVVVVVVVVVVIVAVVVVEVVVIFVVVVVLLDNYIPANHITIRVEYPCPSYTEQHRYISKSSAAKLGLGLDSRKEPQRPRTSVFTSSTGHRDPHCRNHQLDRHVCLDACSWQ